MTILVGQVFNLRRICNPPTEATGMSAFVGRNPRSAADPPVGFTYGRMASCARLLIALAAANVKLRRGRLAIGRRLPACPTFWFAACGDVAPTPCSAADPLVGLYRPPKLPSRQEMRA